MDLKKKVGFPLTFQMCKEKHAHRTKISRADNGVKKGHSVAGNPPKQNLREEESQEGGFIISKLRLRHLKKNRIRSG